MKKSHKKHKNYIIAGVIALVVISVYLLYTISTSPGDTQPKKVTIKNNENTERCDALKEEIKSMLYEVNHCAADTDCVMEWRYDCPFGCYMLYNKDADLGLIDQKVRTFTEEECETCEYQCVIPPEQEEIRCIDNRCEDIRHG